MSLAFPQAYRKQMVRLRFKHRYPAAVSASCLVSTGLLLWSKGFLRKSRSLLKVTWDENLLITFSDAVCPSSSHSLLSTTIGPRTARACHKLNVEENMRILQSSV